jgi:hypothetical protein
MVTQYDDKGKIFTQVISKRPVTVVVQTSQQRIQGTMHVRLSERTIDELNQSPKFLALTDGEVFDAAGNALYTFSFMSVNIDQVVWVIPADDLTLNKVNNE